MISKTEFKKFLRCPRYAGFYQMQKNHHFMVKYKGKVIDENSTESINIKKLFVDTKDSLTMQEYYQKLEEYTAQEVQKKFQIKIHYSLDTSLQKMLIASYLDYDYYCYLDGYYEDEKNLYLFETKATTSKKIENLCYSEKGKKVSIFSLKDGIYQLRHIDNPKLLEESRYFNLYQKLFDRESDLGQYVFDLAFQYFLYLNQENYFYKEPQLYLAILNADFIYDGKSYEGLVSFVDVTTVVVEMQELIKNDFKRLNEYLDELDISNGEIGAWCGYRRPDECPYAKVCFNDFSCDGSIFELIDRHFKFVVDGKKVDIYQLAKNYRLISELNKEIIPKINNQIQYDVLTKKIPHYRKDKIKAALDLLEYPLYYLDFEAFNCPIPRFIYEKPYDQSVFQYSLHIENKPGNCDIDQDHLGYLAHSNKSDERYQLAKKLCSDIGDKGSIIVYNKAFEKTRLEEFATYFPDLRSKLLNIANRLFDLIDVVNTNVNLYKSLGFSENDAKMVNIYDSRLKGSYSIKKVLPLVSDLSYENLEVKNGVMAMDAYYQFDKVSESEFTKLYESLIQYCKLDTYSMVLIVKFLYKIVNN